MTEAIRSSLRTNTPDFADRSEGCRPRFRPEEVSKSESGGDNCSPELIGAQKAEALWAVGRPQALNESCSDEANGDGGMPEPEGEEETQSCRSVRETSGDEDGSSSGDEDGEVEVPSVVDVEVGGGVRVLRNDEGCSASDESVDSSQQQEHSSSECFPSTAT